MSKYVLSDDDRSILLRGIERIAHDAVVRMSTAADNEDVQTLKNIIHSYDACKGLEYVIKHATEVMTNP